MPFDIQRELSRRSRHAHRGVSSLNDADLAVVNMDFRKRTALAFMSLRHANYCIIHGSCLGSDETTDNACGGVFLLSTWRKRLQVKVNACTWYLR